MSDTSKNTAASIQAAIYRKMTPAQKWAEFCRMREAAWQLKAAGLRAQHPNWFEQEIELQVRKIFLYAST